MRKRRSPPKIVAVLMIAGFLLLLPVLLPFAALLNFLENRRLKHTAQQFHCVQCGKILGRESLRRADNTWQKQMREFRVKHPGVRYRIVRKLHAICAFCDAEYTYFNAERTFKLITEP